MKNNSKTIWIFNHYADDLNGQATRSFDFGVELVKRGHRVTILSSSFNHYNFQERKKYHKNFWIKESCNDVNFIWIKTFKYKKNDWRRVLNILDYGAKSFLVGIKLKEKPDIIIGKTFHPLAPLVAFLVSKIKRSKFFFEVGDLWPQTLIDLGKFSEKNIIVILLKFLEKFLYKKSDKIITLLPYAHEYITKLGIPNKKIVWIPNGICYERYQNIKKYTGILNDPIKLIYIGGMTKCHVLDLIIKNAKKIQDKYDQKIKFILIGGGAEKENLIKLSQKYKVKNVEFCESIPKYQVPQAMEKADILILALRDIPLYKYGVSLNKLFDYLASGRPIIFSTSTRGNYVDEAKSGIVVSPKKPYNLSNAIIKLINLSPEERKKMGENGIKFVKKHNSIPALVNKLESCFK